jgi:hypothetical protein
MNLAIAAFKLAFEDQLEGGLADEHEPSEFDPMAIAKGILVEFEHTNDPMVALEITMDHLTEDGRYYDALEVAEKFLESLKPSEED